MIKIEIMKLNKATWEKYKQKVYPILNEFDKVVADTVLYLWLSNNKWLGGLGNGKKGDAVFTKAMKILNISFDDVYCSFERQMGNAIGIMESIKNKNF